MFAPEGYIRWTDLLPELHKWGEKILLAHDLEKLDQDPLKAFRADVDAGTERFLLACKRLNEAEKMHPFK